MIPGPPLDGNGDAWKAYLAFWLEARANMPDALERVARQVSVAIQTYESRVQQRNASIQLKLERIEALEKQRDNLMGENDKLRATLRQTHAMLKALERTIYARAMKMVWDHPNAFTSATKDDGGRHSEPVGESGTAGAPGVVSGASGDAQHGALDRQDSAPGEERPKPPPDAAEFW